VKICQKRDEVARDSAIDSWGNESASDNESDDDATTATSPNKKSFESSVRLEPLATPTFFAHLRSDASFAGPRTRLAELEKRFQTLYSEVFCGGSEEMAQAELLMVGRAQAFAEASSANSYTGARTFRLGFRIGCCLLLVAWLIWDVGIDFALLSQDEQFSMHEQCNKARKTTNHQSVMNLWFVSFFPVYRGMLIFALALWCWGGCLFVMNHCRINYLYILELDPRTTGNANETFWEASTVTIVLLSSFILHFKVLRCDFPSKPLPLGFWPMIPFLTILYRAVTPWSDRKFAWKALWGFVRSPMVTVTFIHNFAGEFQKY
jgi:hypothetical protein